MRVPATGSSSTSGSHELPAFEADPEALSNTLTNLDGAEAGAALAQLARERAALESAREALERERAAHVAATRPAKAGPSSARHRAVSARRHLPRQRRVPSWLWASLAVLAVVGGLLLALLLAPSPPAPTLPARGRQETPELRALRRKAEAGDPAAMLSLGVFYREGVGARPDLAEAKRWLGLAAERGDAGVSARAVLLLNGLREEEELARRQVEAAEQAEQQAARDRQRAAREERARLAAEREREGAEQARRLAADEAARRRAETRLAEEVAEWDADLSTEQPPTPELLERALERLAELTQDEAVAAEVRAAAGRALARARQLGSALAVRLLAEARDRLARGDWSRALDQAEEAAGWLGAESTPDLEALRSACREERRRQEAAAREARRAEEASAETARAARAERLAALERAARARTQEWLEARSPRALRCDNCGGEGLVACRECQGSGTKLVILVGTQGGTTRAPCGRCNGQGRLRCPCPGGYSTLGLKRAFWDFASPELRRGRARKQFHAAVVAGQLLADQVGPSLALEGARIRTVAVRHDRVVVELEASAVRSPPTRAGSGGGLGPTPWDVTWVEVDGRLYLAAPGEAAAPLLDPAEAAGEPTGTRVSDVVARIEQVLARRDALTELAWQDAWDRLGQELTGAPVEDVGVLVEIRPQSSQLLVEVRVDQTRVTIACPGAAREALSRLQRGQAVEFAGVLRRGSSDALELDGQVRPR